MSDDFATLAARMSKIANAVELDISDLTNEISLAILADVSKDTPVDVGTARSNWQVSLNGPESGVRPARAPWPSRWRPPYADPGTTKSETRNQAGVVWAGAAVVRGRRPEQAVYITNNVPYIGPLNAGHSPQSAAGWIERGVASGRSRAIREFKFKNLRRL